MVHVGVGGCSVATEVQWPQKLCVNDGDEDLLSPVKQSNGDCLKVAAPQVESQLRIFCDWFPSAEKPNFPENCSKQCKFFLLPSTTMYQCVLP